MTRIIEVIRAVVERRRRILYRLRVQEQENETGCDLWVAGGIVGRLIAGPWHRRVQLILRLAVQRRQRCACSGRGSETGDCARGMAESYLVV